MSVANVVLLGFTTGSGAALLPTLGFGSGEEVLAGPGVIVAGRSSGAPVRGRSSGRIEGRSSEAAVRGRSSE